MEVQFYTNHKDKTIQCDCGMLVLYSTNPEIRKLFSNCPHCKRIIEWEKIDKVITQEEAYEKNF